MSKKIILNCSNNIAREAKQPSGHVRVKYNKIFFTSQGQSFFRTEDINHN